MKNKKLTSAVDVCNYQAIEWLEHLGNASPTEGQITLMETLLRVLGLLLHDPVALSEFKNLANAETIKLLIAIQKNADGLLGAEGQANSNKI